MKKAIFKLIGSDFSVDIPFEGNEISARKAFIEEATKRLGTLNLNDWELVRIEP